MQDPSGTTNMDFEFNQRQCTPGQTPADPDCTSNGVTPIRTAGDLLVTYDLSQGGTRPTLSLARVDRHRRGAPAVGPDRLEQGDRLDQHLRRSRPADADGLGAHSARTFGEAQLDLSAIFDPNKCESFGSAYLKSRSSDSFTAALKDFVPPVAVNISNCGGLERREVHRQQRERHVPRGDNAASSRAT